MSLVDLSLQHGRSLEDARVQLEQTVTETQRRFGALLSRTEWSPARDRVTMAGSGFELEVWVDPKQVHLRGDIPLLGKLLGGPLFGGLRGLLEQRFQKQLK